MSIGSSSTGTTAAIASPVARASRAPSATGFGRAEERRGGTMRTRVVKTAVGRIVDKRLCNVCGRGRLWFWLVRLNA